jgi:aminoglycoside phosphotransferase (APT) family kinase protein
VTAHADGDEVMSGTARARIADILAEALGRRIPDVRASLLSGGRSNLTYRLTDGTDSWVLRRPPLGHVLQSAHDMRREFRVIQALRHTKVPVPDPIVYCEDVDVIGMEFYVMSMVEGRVLRSAEDMSGLSAADALRLSEVFIDTLAELHSVDPGSVGLADLGRPSGYLDRQLVRWRKQLASSESREVPGFTELADALSGSTPSTATTTIVHGDFRLDNAILHPHRADTILAVLDWEMATLGDPLADLGLFYLYWQGWQGLDNPIAATPAEHAGFATFDHLAERYQRRVDIDLQGFEWYRGFALFKFAVICEGIHYRHLQGLAHGEGFDQIGAMVPELVRRGLAELQP